MTPNSEDGFDPWDESNIEKAKSIIQMDPDSSVGYSYLGEILYYREKYDEAITELLKAAEIISKTPLPEMSRMGSDGIPKYNNVDDVKFLLFVKSTFSILGDCYLRLGNHEEAEGWLKKSIDALDHDAGQWARYGQALAKGPIKGVLLAVTPRDLCQDREN
jgi:tetratricopeptide (TPR) repeat protein